MMVSGGRPEAVLSVSFSPDGDLTAAAVGTVAKLWNTHSGALTATLSGHEGACETVAFSPDGTLVATEDDARVLLWSLSVSRWACWRPAAVVLTSLSP